MKTEIEIKHELSLLLGTENVDYSKVLSLSNELSKFDKDSVRFSVDAGIIDRLGSELVARHETAVSELVKNSYDADATNVKLTFINSNHIGGKLIIEDDGAGMSRDELINGFMRISSTSKIHSKISPKFKRNRAGQKGIGRFAVQRLGNKLTIITQDESYNTALELKINWGDYLNDTDLFSVSNTVKEVSKLPNSGTILIIDNLSDKWTKASIKRIYHYISEIMQPFSLAKITSNINFNVSLVKIENEVAEEIKDIQINVYDHATAIIDGEILNDGTGYFQINSDKLNIKEDGYISNDPQGREMPFDKLRSVKFRAFYFIYKSNLIPKMHETAIQKLASKFGGIRLYRNGFRVLPYGETGDDWLKLDASTRKRSLLPVHANINFFGFVEITDSNNLFQETSSREGLITNDAFMQLQNFVYRTIMSAVVRIAEIRNIKILSNQKKYDKNHYEKIEVTINNIATTMEELEEIFHSETGNIKRSRKSKQKFDEAKADFLRLRKLQKEEQEKTFKEKSMLRVLGSIGLTIGQFIHEIKYYLDNMRSDANYLADKLSGNEELYKRANTLVKNLSEFHTYTSYFNNIMSNNVVRELEPIEISSVVNDFIESLMPDCEKSNIQMNVPIYNGVLLYTKPMHTSEWSSILFNLFTNAKKAIYKKGNTGLLGIECGVSDNMIYLEFSDNGIGIDKDIEDRIFDEFFTTTGSLNFDDIDSNNAILGTGLGLKIVKDIVESYKGKIYVVSPKGDYATCMRIEIPKLNIKEYEKYEL